MNKRILLSLILGTFAANPGVMLGMHAPHKTVNKENTKNLDRANTQDSPSKRPAELDGIFTRRPEKLAALADSKSPNSKKALIEERTRLNNYLIDMYGHQYDTPNPQDPSPTKGMAHKKRKKNQEKAKQLSRKKVRTARNLFEQQEDWDANVEILDTYAVNQNDAIINPFCEDEDGRLNLHRMLNGRAPIGPDGRSVNLHHWLREDPAPEGEYVLLGEITRDLHTRESGIFHFPDEGIRDRSRFDFFRNLYWQTRAMDIIESELFAR